jgi:hypothetical protein
LLRENRFAIVDLPHLTGELFYDEVDVEIGAGGGDCRTCDCRLGRRFHGKGQEEGGCGLHAGRPEDRGLRAGRLHDDALLGRRKVVSVADGVLEAVVSEVTELIGNRLESAAIGTPIQLVAATALCDR